MSDNKDTVKSKISMDLKNRKSKDTGNTPAATPKANKAKEIDGSIEPGKPIEPVKPIEPQLKTNPSISSSEQPHNSDSAYKHKRGKSLAPLKAMAIALTISMVFLSAFVLFFETYKKAGHTYYVESTIAPPSEVENSTSALVLGSCVVDFTKKATPDELTQMVFDEYGYEKNDKDFVQTIINTGCDTSLSLPKITNGSALNAIF